MFGRNPVPSGPVGGEPPRLPLRVVDERGMRQTTDTDALAPVVDAVLARCQDQVQQYRDGNRKVVGFLVGQCMRESRGTGNPKLFNQMLVERLEG